MKSGQICAAFFVSVRLDFPSVGYYTSQQENSRQRAKFRPIPRISKNFRTFAPTKTQTEMDRSTRISEFIYQLGKSQIEKNAPTEEEARIIINTIDEYDLNPWPTVWWLIARRITKR